MGLFDKLNELNDKIDAIIPGGKKNTDADLARRQKVPGVPAITREHQGEDNDSTDSNGEKQEVINGHLVVDGVDLGPVNTGSLSVQEDVLNILGIPASYSVPDRILLPGDLAKVKFAKEPDGFARDEVAAFYDAYGMTLFYDMEERSGAAMERDLKIRDIEQQIKRLMDLKDVLVHNKLDYRLEDDEI